MTLKIVLDQITIKNTNENNTEHAWLYWLMTAFIIFPMTWIGLWQKWKTNINILPLFDLFKRGFFDVEREWDLTSIFLRINVRLGICPLICPWKRLMLFWIFSKVIVNTPALCLTSKCGQSYIRSKLSTKSYCKYICAINNHRLSSLQCFHRFYIVVHYFVLTCYCWCV